MKRRRVWPEGVVWSFLLAGLLWAAEANIALDAVTGATEGYNTFEGELDFLTDGRYPDNSDRPGVFIWPTKGNLVFQFTEPRRVAGLRLCIGKDAGSYAAIAYLGARLGESGQTDTGKSVMVADVYNFDFEPNTWVELPFPPQTKTDYIELITESGAEFYEIEILAQPSEPSAVKAISWATIKQQW